METDVCSLCLNVFFEHLQQMEIAMSDMLKFITPAIDLTVNCDSKICKGCSECLSTCYNFKRSIQIDNLRRVEAPEGNFAENEKDVNNACGLCKNKLIIEIPIVKNPDEICSTTMLEKSFPERKTPFLDVSSICERCLKGVTKMFNFISKIENTIEAIKSYCLSKGISEKNKYDQGTLYDVYMQSLGLKIKNEYPDEMPFNFSISEKSNLLADSSKEFLERKIKCEDVNMVEVDVKPVLTIKTEGAEEERPTILNYKMDQLLPQTHLFMQQQASAALYGVIDEEMYQCDICTYKTKFKKNLQKHKMVHKFESAGVKMYKCTKCDYLTRHVTWLEKHNLFHEFPAERTTYRCAACQYQTQLAGSIRNHYQTHQPKRNTFKCEYCTYHTEDKNAFVDHISKHEISGDANIIKCEFCCYTTKHKAYIKQHSLTHVDASKIPRFTCHFCPFQTKTKIGLRRHIFRHKNPSKKPQYVIFSCKICSYKCKRKLDLKNHIMVFHQGLSMSVTFPCNVCSYQAKYKSDLKRHMKQHDPDRQTTYQCPLCPKQCQFESRLKQHLAVHKTLKCEFCSFQTISGYEHKVHLQSKHAELMTLKCAFCIYKTKSKKLLLNHMLQHKDNNMYKCDYCEYKTKKANIMVQHILNHKNGIDSITFKCDICCLVTKHKSSLDRHMLTHKEPAFKCDLCPYNASQKRLLVAHMIQHKTGYERQSDPSKYVKIEKVESPISNESLLVWKSSLQRQMLNHQEPTFKCDLCPFIASKQYLLDVHVVTHKVSYSDRVYSCEFCTFKTKNDKFFTDHLIAHEKRQSEPSQSIKIESPKKKRVPLIEYSCDLCPYETKREYLLARHKALQHTTLKCSTCEYETLDSKEFMQHSYTHLCPIENPYQCDTCTFKTDTKNHLTRHIESTHPEEGILHQCAICSKTLKTKRGLQKHKFLCHKDASDIATFKCDFCEFRTICKKLIIKHVSSHNKDVTETDTI